MKKLFSKIICFIFIFAISFSSFSFSSNMKKEVKKETVAAKNVDYDLTNLSATILLSQLKNIQADYKKYLGKSIKYNGIMKSISANGNSYYMAMCNDAAACCSAGFEFILGNNSKNYPKEKSKIEIEGVLQEYTEDGKTYLHLINAKVKTLESSK